MKRSIQIRTALSVMLAGAWLAAVVPPGQGRAGVDAATRATPAADMASPAIDPVQIAPGDIEAFTDGFVEQAMARDHVAGVAVAVVQGGRPVLLKGYGVARFGPDPLPVSPTDTLFRIGSIAKTFTWIAVMQEVAAGRMSFDDPVNLHLPPDLKLPTDGRRGPVRVRNLLAHDAGFEDLTFGHMMARDPRTMEPMKDYLRAHRPRRVREPGQVSSYSNYGAVLAGALAVQTSGARDFPTLMEDRLFGPLGLSDTSFRERHGPRADLPAPLGRARQGRLADALRWDGRTFQAQPYENLTPIAPAGAAVSTASDMARYMIALLDDETRAALIGRGHFGPGPFPSMGGAESDVNSWPGGFAEHRRHGLYVYGHDGATLNFFANMILLPELDLGIFLVTNSESGAALVDAAPGAIVDRFLRSPDRTMVQAPKRDLSKYAGTYLATRRTYTGLARFIGLITTQYEVVVTDQGLLDASMGRLYRPTDDPGRFDAVDGRGHLRFEQVGARPARWTTEINAVSFERVGPLRSLPVMASVTAVALATALLVLVGALARLRWPLPRSVSSAGGTQAAAATGYLASAALFAVWAVRSEDPINVVYDWPGPILSMASALAALAALLSLLQVAMAIRAWTVGTPSVGRRLAYSASATIFLVYATFLASWSALHFWG